MKKTPEKRNTLEEAAKKLGASSKTVSIWARKHRPRIRPTIHSDGRSHSYTESQIARIAAAHHVALLSVQTSKVEQPQQVEELERQKQSRERAPVPLSQSRSSKLVCRWCCHFGLVQGSDEGD